MVPGLNKLVWGLRDVVLFHFNDQLQSGQLRVDIGLREIGSKLIEHKIPTMHYSLSVFLPGVLDLPATLTIDVTDNVEPAGPGVLALDHSLLRYLMAGAYMVDFDQCGLSFTRNIRLESAEAARFLRLPSAGACGVNALHVYSATDKSMRNGAFANGNYLVNGTLGRQSGRLRDLPESPGGGRVGDCLSGAGNRSQLLRMCAQQAEVTRQATMFPHNSRLRVESTLVVSGTDANNIIGTLLTPAAQHHTQRVTELFCTSAFPPVYQLHSQSWPGLYKALLHACGISSLLLLNSSTPSHIVANELMGNGLMVSQLLGNPKLNFRLTSVQISSRARFFDETHGFVLPLSPRTDGNSIVRFSSMNADLWSHINFLDCVSERFSANKRLREARQLLSEASRVWVYKDLRKLAKQACEDISVVIHSLTSVITIRQLPSPQATAVVLALCGKHELLRRLVKQLSAANKDDVPHSRITLLRAMALQLVSPVADGPLPAPPAQFRGAQSQGVGEVSLKLLQQRVVPYLFRLTEGGTHGLQPNPQACNQWLCCVLQPSFLPFVPADSSSSNFGKIAVWRSVTYSSTRRRFTNWALFVLGKTMGGPLTSAPELQVVPNLDMNSDCTGLRGKRFLSLLACVHSGAVVAAIKDLFRPREERDTTSVAVVVETSALLGHAGGHPVVSRVLQPGLQSGSTFFPIPEAGLVLGRSTMDGFFSRRVSRKAVNLQVTSTEPLVVKVTHTASHEVSVVNDNQKLAETLSETNISCWMVLGQVLLLGSGEPRLTLVLRPLAPPSATVTPRQRRAGTAAAPTEKKKRRNEKEEEKEKEEEEEKKNKEKKKKKRKKKKKKRRKEEEKEKEKEKEEKMMMKMKKKKKNKNERKKRRKRQTANEDRARGAHVGRQTPVLTRALVLDGLEVMFCLLKGGHNGSWQAMCNRFDGGAEKLIWLLGTLLEGLQNEPLQMPIDQLTRGEDGRLKRKSRTQLMGMARHPSQLDQHTALAAFGFAQ